MKILITGSDGNIGSYLTSYLADSCEVLPFNRECLDITNKNKCIEIVNEVKPDAVIHCAALTDIDLCETNEKLAYNVNTIGTLNMAYCCSMHDIPLIYLSSNHVYDGKKRTPYYETDTSSPVNIYGKTKLAAESLIRTLCRKYFIIRTSWVFGGKNCFIKAVADKAELPLLVSSNQTASPTYIKDLCLAIEAMLKSEMYGIYNCVNSGSIKKTLWFSNILSYLSIEKEVVELPESFAANKAPRPYCTILNTSLVKNCFNIEFRSWESALMEYLNK